MSYRFVWIGHMRRERGLAPAVEAAVIVPGLVLIVGLIVVLAGIVLARQELHAVASAAARAAALERTPAAGERAARELIARSLPGEGISCAEPRVTVGAEALAAPLGAEGNVEVRVRCTLSLSAVSLPMMPGSIELDTTAESPVDRYRAR